MSNPQEPQGEPTKVKSASSAAYPLQLILIVVIFAVAIGIYIYLTSGDDHGASPTGSAIEHTVQDTV